MLQVLVNSLLLGSLYGLMGVGFSLMWGVMNIINIAYGTLMICGAYVSLVICFLLPQINPFLSLFFVFFILFILGAGIQKYLYNLLMKADLSRILLLSFGLNMILQNILLVIFKADYQQIVFTSHVYRIKGLSIPLNRLYISVIAWFVIIVVYYFLKKTRMGRAIRATALNRDAAQICGVKISQIYCFTGGLVVAMAGVAGSLSGGIFLFSPIAGAEWLLRIFVICIIGGLGNVAGAIVGGIILALAEAFGGMILGTQWQTGVGFAILYIVLFFKPEGILSSKRS